MRSSGDSANSAKGVSHQSLVFARDLVEALLRALVALDQLQFLARVVLTPRGARLVSR